MKRLRALLVLLLLGAAVAAVLALASPVDPAAIAFDPPRPLEGPLAPNDGLRTVARIGEGLAGPEDVAVDARGRVYCGLADGTIRRRSGDGGGFEIFADVGGRPQGLDFDAGGWLWVADADGRLLAVDTRGEIADEVTTVDGEALRFVNDVDVASNGRVYFSESSRRHGRDAVRLEALEARPSGRLLEYAPDDGTTRVLLDGLFFANGVAVAPDDSFVLVVETFAYRVRAIDLATGSATTFVDRLPGFPDGIATDDDGRFWLAIERLRRPMLDRLHGRPWAKRLAAWLPAGGGDPDYGLVVELDPAGAVLSSLHDTDGERSGGVTSVEPVGGSLWLGSATDDSIGRVDRP